jgi:membrane protein
LDDQPQEKDKTGPGRQAMRPAEFSQAAWKGILWRTWLGIGEDNLSIIAAGVAFFAVFAVFPAFAALIALYGLVADPAQVSATLDIAEPVLPPDVFTIFADQVDQLVGAEQSTLGIATLISFALALWSARLGVMALVQGLNVVYGEVDTRNIVVQYLFSLLLTFVLILFSIVSLLAVVAVPAVLRFVELGALGATLAQIAPPVILGFAVILVIGGLYRYAPSRSPARKRWITPGAVIATILWVIVSLGLSFYFGRFTNFNQTYGSLGAVIALMFWLYASAYVVLLGAEVNSQMELQTGRDTTTGRPKPMGKRGAFVADHVA